MTGSSIYKKKTDTAFNIFFTKNGADGAVISPR